MKRVDAESVAVLGGAGHRRGVLLLVVLSLLTLFLLLGTTFLILSSRARTTAGAFLRLAQDQTTTPGAYSPMLREAAWQVIRGASRSGSAIRYHDLLGDRYGGAGSRKFGIEMTSAPAGSVRGAEPPQFVAGNQVLRLRLREYDDSSGEPLLSGEASAANRSGQILTFLDGPEGVALTSCRIITSLDANANNSSVVYVERPRRLADPTSGSLAQDLVSACSDGVLEVLINDRDFAGAGIEASTTYDAYQPNWQGVVGSPGGATNEDYDAVDEQNMAVAGNSVAGDVSFHRPRLVDFWRDYFQRPEQELLGILRKTTQQLNADTSPDGLRNLDIAMRFRRATLRPFAFDHKPEPGSQVDFAGKPMGTDLSAIRTLTPDVDADGDGTLDSIWLDLGQPPITMPDRRLVKPLFAIKCVDLGGRLNLNAHGSAVHANLPDAWNPALADSGTGRASLRWGSGFGPAEVRLDGLDGRVFPQVVAGGTTAVYGRAAGIRRDIPPQAGRYGRDVESGRPLAGLPAQALATWRNASYWLISDRGVPEAWATDPGLYAGAPPDFWGRIAIGVDRRGNPAFLNAASDASDLRNGPYYLDLFRPKPSASSLGQASTAPWVDQPFTASELEAMLRPFDRDNAATLPPRLITLDLATNDQLRELVTTESWDTPAVIGGPALPAILDDSTPGSSRNNFDHDLVRGLRMDLNRPFGNGLDDDRDDIVDEPTEMETPTETNQSLALTGTLGSSSGWYLTRGPLPPTMGPGGEVAQPGRADAGLRARQLFAYHLFNLANGVKEWSVGAGAASAPGLWLCSGTWSGKSADGTTTFTPRDGALVGVGGSDTTEERIRKHSMRVLAQWAINVVDFMDPDAIMTPFRFGSGPSDVVWGCEAPDVVITETLAFHDRGIADDVAHGKLSTDKDGDTDWDQVRPPRASLFIELHAVRSPTLPQPPRELYDADGRLNLGRRPVAGTTGTTAPIWRLALTSASPTRTSADDIFKRLQSNPDTTTLDPDGRIDADIHDIRRRRYVWLTSGTPVSASPRGPSGTNTFVLESPAQTATISRGDFLVIGPRESTPVGSSTESVGEPSPQSIKLAAAAPAVTVTGLTAGSTPCPPEGRACWVSMPVTGSRVPAGLSITGRDVGAYYPAPSADEIYDPPLDQPLTDENLAGFLDEGTYFNVATVFLERLADPTRVHQPDSTSAEWNPYIAVDFMPIDLTTMNGESTGPETAVIAGAVKPLRTQRPVHFHTRQRGMVTDSTGAPATPFDLQKALDGTAPPSVANPWVPGFPSEVSNPPGPKQKAEQQATGHFAYELNQSSASLPNQCPCHTLGWTNISFGRRLDSGIPASMVGAAATPWPWLVWNDRPFASEYELLLVPCTPPGRLLTNYRNPSIDPPRNPLAAPLASRSPYDELGVFPAAGHLLPFTGINDPADGEPGEPKRSRNADVLSRLFSYVRVSSPFVGTRRGLKPWASPDVASDPMARFLPPFNFISAYREPGHVNINTIDAASSVAAMSPGDLIWKSLLGGFVPPAAPTWQDVVASTQRNVVIGSTSVKVSHPWRMLTPYLAGTGNSGAVEPFSLRHPPLGNGQPDPQVIASEFSARSLTLLRSTTAPAPVDVKPLFGPARQAVMPASGNQFEYAERNAWFAFEPMIRAASNTTVRSEVYAIWVTMGFFEVEAVSSSDSDQAAFVGSGFRKFPDGYRLLREYGTQSGDVSRHRGFFIFDRSIPVGYVPGDNVNVADGILVERLVE